MRSNIGLLDTALDRTFSFFKQKGQDYTTTKQATMNADMASEILSRFNRQNVNLGRPTPPSFGPSTPLVGGALNNTQVAAAPAPADDFFSKLFSAKTLGIIVSGVAGIALVIFLALKAKDFIQSKLLQTTAALSAAETRAAQERAADLAAQRAIEQAREQTIAKQKQEYEAQQAQQAQEQQAQQAQQQTQEPAQQAQQTSEATPAPPTPAREPEAVPTPAPAPAPAPAPQKFTLLADLFP